jgi:hypothetical protein
MNPVSTLRPAARWWGALVEVWGQRCVVQYQGVGWHSLVGGSTDVHGSGLVHIGAACYQ